MIRPLTAWLLSGAFATGALAQLQRPNLPDTPTANRFTLTDRVWPGAPGQASICVWEDDKLAAVSVTVDDNCQPDIAWWLDRSARYGFRVTWFVITGRVDSGNSFNGTWAEYGRVRAAGHDVQSHTVLHLHTEDPLWSWTEGIRAEYRDSQTQIEAGMPGHRCFFLAYPGGTNSWLNDRTVADDYYAAARGTSGGFNPPNKTDYLNTRGMSGFTIGSGTSFGDLNSLFNASDLRYYRGWAVLIYHKVNDYGAVQPLFDWMESRRADVWYGAFGEVARYGQERDTATLTVTGATASAIAFTLSDEMMDSRFDYPLTVKLRLPDAWRAVAATQNGAPIPARFVRHNGAPYALVKAVPDRGPVQVVEPSGPSGSATDYQRWLRDHALPLTGEGLGAPSASPAGDGVPNALKHALGLDPRQPGLGARYRGGTSTEGGADYLDLTFRRPYPPPPDVSYGAEASPDAGAWSPFDPVDAADAVSDGVQTLTWRDAQPIGASGARRFLRLSAVIR